MRFFQQCYSFRGQNQLKALGILRVMIYKKRKKFVSFQNPPSGGDLQNITPNTGPSSTAKLGNQILRQVHKYVRFSEYLLHPPESRKYPSVQIGGKYRNRNRTTL
jgi:hypothetical protein